ncbi:hypothetical protein M422DRAFT_130870, partial [Sphaerobolus stellatus SS14]
TGFTHARHRRILVPGFSYNSLKDLVPIFTKISDKLAVRWGNICQQDSKGSSLIDVHSWLSRATLDAIGEGSY